MNGHKIDLSKSQTYNQLKAHTAPCWSASPFSSLLVTALTRKDFQ